MRTLRRLERVDVILRRTDAWFCDPLELRADSKLGVPGLVEAARLGGVSIVNTLGSGVLENPGLLPYLPRLAEHLLGEQLLLPSVPTWWCGDEDGRRHVLAHMDSLVIKPIARAAGPTAVFPWELSSDGRDDLRRRIEAQPGGWAGQETIELASAPTLTSTGLEARPTVLRTFAVARQDSYTAMPGGLTRVAGSQVSSGDRAGGRSPRISNQAGAISKDTWVLASEPEKLSGFWLVPGPPVAAVDPAASMSSRAAENLFWMGRYAEAGRCHGPSRPGGARPAQRFPAGRQPRRHRMPPGAAHCPHPGELHVPRLCRAGCRRSAAGPRGRTVRPGGR